MKQPKAIHLKLKAALHRIREESQDDWIGDLEPAIAPAVNRYARNGAKSKVLGAVYTPPRVADALTRWAVRHASDRVLDPSCGEGVFLATARTRLADLGARRPAPVGVDIDAETARQIGAVHSDFFAWARTAPQFNVILGNPPFIRSHLFSEQERTLAFSALERIGLKPSRLMSTWAPFLALSASLLDPETGRLAMVIPEELLTVGYADGLRRWLLQRFRRVIISFPDSNVFPEVQQAVVLVLCDQEPVGHQGLLTLDYAALEEGDHARVESAPVWPWNSKWSHLYLPAAARFRLGDWWPALGWEPLCAYGRAEVGIVTGDNNFFIVSGPEAARFDPRHLVPVITSAKDLRGIGFEADDFAAVVRQNRRAYLLDLRGPAPGLPASEQAHLAQGQRTQVSQRYKCRVRQPWYTVPGIRATDAVMLRQSGDMPRLVHLGQRCAATDTIHRVNWHRPEFGPRFAAGFLNTFTLLAAEVTGRSYGGGVLELMPSEANALPLPPPDPVLADIFHDVDARVRARDAAGAVAQVDARVLPPWMTPTDRDDARHMLNLLVRRRQTRASGSPPETPTGCSSEMQG